MHWLPSQNVMYGSELDQFDIGVACSSGEILVLSVRYVKMGSGVMELSVTLTWFPRFPMPMKKLSGLILRWMKFEWIYSMVLEVRSFAIGRHPKQNPCHIPYTVSWVAISLSNSMTELDNSITLGLNTVYLSDWSWRNAQCTRQNRLGEKGPRLPTQMWIQVGQISLCWPWYCHDWLYGASHLFLKGIS